MNQKGFANIILVVVIVILAGAVGYFVFVKKSEPVAQQPTPTQTKTPISPTPTGQTTNLKTYTNTEFGFQLTFPDDWKDYTVTRRLSGTKDLVVFDFGTSFAGFTIGVWGNKNLYTEMSKVRSEGEKIAENDKYIFTLSWPQDLVMGDKQVNEVKLIISTFKFTK